MSFVWAGALAVPLRNALLFSVAAHLFVLLATGFRIPPPVVDSGVANKKLLALKVSVTKGSVPPVVFRPLAPIRPQAPAQPAARTPVLATAAVASSSYTNEIIAPIPSGNLAPMPAEGAVPGTPDSIDLPAAAPGVAAAGGEALLPDGYLDAVRGYRIAVATHAKRFRLYPPAAREMGIGGRSEIEIVVAVANSPELRVRQSSGHQELDRAALEMLRRSVDLVELPTLLKGRRLAITLPVEFLPPP